LHHQASSRLGPDHLFTLIARGNLAKLRGEAGDAAGAAADYQQLLTDAIRILGPDAPGLSPPATTSHSGGE
jgi:hypothetical protein